MAKYDNYPRPLARALWIAESVANGHGDNYDDATLQAAYDILSSPGSIRHGVARAALFDTDRVTEPAPKRRLVAFGLLPIEDTQTGMPGWLARSAGKDIGRLYDFGQGEGMRWHGSAMDGTRFNARSRAKLLQKLKIHAATPSAPAI